MKPKSQFTLVSRGAGLSSEQTSLRTRVERRLESQPETLRKFQRLPQALREAVLSHASAIGLDALEEKSAAAATTEALRPLVAVLKEFGDEPPVMTVGILDLGVRVGRLPALVDKMNSVQKRVGFIQVLAPVPMGLVKSPAYLAEWIDAHSAAPLASPEREALRPNLILEDFYTFAESVREEHHLDLLVGLTPALLANVHAGAAEWDFHAHGSESICAVSTFGLREYASGARRTLDAAVGMLIVGQTFAAFDSGIQYHDDTRGCVFDSNNDDMNEIVRSIEAMDIDSLCMMSFTDERDGEAAYALVRMLKAIKRPL